VVVGTNGGHAYAFDVATGIPRWDYRADGVVNLAAPLIAGGRVYMAGGGHSDRVHAVDAGTGAPIAGWPVTLPGPDPDLTGRRITRYRAISSFASAGGLLLIETRLDDALDTDSDGVPDHYLSREWAIALDPMSGAVVWQRLMARVVFSDPDDLPGFVVCPTPAVFSTDSGPALAAFASSLVGTVSLLDVATGADDGDVTTAGRALASPVLANGRLITVAENGTIEAHLSSVNHPPAAPVLAASPAPLDASAALLRWSAARDPDGEQASYEVRIDADGEILQTFAQRIVTEPGAASVVPSSLVPGVTYTVAVRARDPQGAYSPWSAPETFTVVASGSVSVDGQPAASLRAAVAAAGPGAVIALGPGIFPLAQTLVVPSGVTIAGAGAGRTVLDGTGSMIGVTFAAGDGSHPVGLDRVTVTGAQTCISVGGGTDVALTHLILRGCATAAIAVSDGGKARIANATIVENGTGVASAGLAAVKNALVSSNQIGFATAAGGTVSSAYDDLFANETDHQGSAAGPGDISVAVTFPNATTHDYRLVGPQPSTDLGDPTDPVGDEPTPNGGRINLGAFGGTLDAELSTAVLGGSDPPSSPLPTTDGAGHLTHEPGGCAVGGAARPSLSGAFVLCAWLLARRRRREMAKLAVKSTGSSQTSGR
jgi:hypothetical protein